MRRNLQWAKDIPGNIGKAESNWSRIRSAEVGKL